MNGSRLLATTRLLSVATLRYRVHVCVFMPRGKTGIMHLRNEEGSLMVALDYTPHGVCSRSIHVELDDTGSTITGCSFTGGCNGNLKAISKLITGKSVDEVCATLRGNTCGHRPTSCADQLCHALDAAREQAAQSA